MDGYIYFRDGAWQVQKTEVDRNGSEREVFWTGGLTRDEADEETKDCKNVLIRLN